MTQLPQTVSLAPDEEANRLWKGALEAFEKASESFVSLSEAIDLGVRAVEIVAVQRLQPALARFPATIGSLLEKPDPEVNVERDAIALPHSLQFTDVIDLLSGDELLCVSPHLHRGWEDRRFSCRRSRALARETTGTEIGRDAQPKLLRLAAYRNRIFRLPPPVDVVPGEILDAFPALTRLYGRLG